jgi:hypothetical protein
MLTAIMLLLSIDEFVMLHESLVRRIHASWLYVGIPIAALTIIALLYFGYRYVEDKKLFYTIILGLVVLVVGATGFEVVGYNVDFEGVFYQFIVVIEESLEIIGETIIVYALSREIIRRYF